MKIFQKGTAKTETAVKFQRGGPKFSSPDADSGWDQAFVSSVKTWTSSNWRFEFHPPIKYKTRSSTHSS
jgi:hypothetical protein